ncbi:alpha/beta fold hydrolase [Microbacterium binotii]|uniref:alpha/beta fold hydrolase n=1 Tax=Microbacterium binotii TaxID=462710 RepID=UPI001F3248E9|nr:alpha/beta hydrolase [Microbacterium binotii]UIN30098.1 alpha/beta hydrolase [Microbacterium binotii]
MTAASAPVIDVHRVACGTAYTRVSSIRAEGERAFVLVAGIGVAATYFERLAPQLNEFGAVHALDLPGFGGVPHPESAMSIAQYADAVEAVLDELALEDPVLVGHSMGTQIVSEVARRRPEISTLVLIGPVVDPEARRLPRLALRFLRSTWHEPLKIKVLAVGAYLLCGPRWFLRVLPEMMRFPIEELFADIRAHTLVIRGEHDDVVPRAWVERVAREIPFASTWEIGGAAHSVMHGHAEGVARLCVAFARTPRDTDGELNLMPDAEAETPEPRAASVSAAFRAFAARFVEFVGVLRRDDREVARGKTSHARIMKEQQD